MSGVGDGQQPERPDEPFAYTRTGVAPRGRISDPRAAIPLGLLIVAVGVFAVVTISHRNGPVALAVLIGVVAGGLGVLVLWIGVRRWRWMREVKRTTGSYPEV